MVALTPLLPTTAESGKNWVRPVLYNAFKAACVLRHHISEDTKNFSVTQTPVLSIQKHLPYVNRVARYSSDPGASPSIISFRIDRVFKGRSKHPNRFLYPATLDEPDNPEGREVMVKFTRSYCPKLHSFCAEQRHAPGLLGYGTIPGGWYVVLMEMIDQTYTLDFYGCEHFQTWTQDIKSLVKAFHDRGLVHGDLRDANMMVDRKEPERIMLVDFDWGGNVNDGPVNYPTYLVNEELKKHGSPNDLRITKEHDDQVLANTLNKLKEQINKRITEGTGPDLQCISFVPLLPIESPLIRELQCLTTNDKQIKNYGIGLLGHDDCDGNTTLVAMQGCQS